MKISYELLVALPNYQNEKFRVEAEYPEDFPECPTLTDAARKLKSVVLQFPYGASTAFAVGSVGANGMVDVSEIMRWLTANNRNTAWFLEQARQHGPVKTLQDVDRAIFQKVTHGV